MTGELIVTEGSDRLADGMAVQNVADQAPRSGTAPP